MELKWSKSTREPISVTRSHCATGVGRVTKDLRALTSDRDVGRGLQPSRARRPRWWAGDRGHATGRTSQATGSSVGVAARPRRVLGRVRRPRQRSDGDAHHDLADTHARPRRRRPPSPKSHRKLRKPRSASTTKSATSSAWTPQRRCGCSVRWRPASSSTAQQRLFKKERRQGLVQTGQTRIAELQVQSVDLDNSDPKAGRVPTVQVDVCYDVSDVDMVDAGRQVDRESRSS